MSQKGTNMKVSNSSTVAADLPHHIKVEGSSPATTASTWRLEREDVKQMFCLLLIDVCGTDM